MAQFVSLPMIILPYGIHWSTLKMLPSFMWILKLHLSLMQMFLENNHVDSAPAPSIQTLQEGPLTERSRVTFTCRAFAPCPTQPPHLSWNQSGGGGWLSLCRTDMTGSASPVWRSIRWATQQAGPASEQQRASWRSTFPVSDQQTVQSVSRDGWEAERLYILHSNPSTAEP